MRRTNLASILGGLRDEDPEKFVSLVRLAWPDIQAALDRGHSVKVIHERFVKGGVDISYRLFAMYVGQLRREHAQRNAITPDKSESKDTWSGSTTTDGENVVAVVRVPKRRLFGTRAAAQYLGIHERTLRRITEDGYLRARQLGVRRVYRLEDLDSYIESLPSCIEASRI